VRDGNVDDNNVRNKKEEEEVYKKSVLCDDDNVSEEGESYNTNRKNSSLKLLP
jgi:hypothetical protein